MDILRRFIRYLYEYEQEKKMRNVGFVKIEQDMEQCVIHVHGKGFRMEEDAKGLEVYLFWNQDEKCTGINMGVTEPPSPGLNYQLCYTPEDMGEKENYGLVNGIILKDISGNCYAAVWNDDAVNVCQMEKWEMAEEETHEKEKSIAEAPEEQEVKECGKRYKVRKIQRKDMVCLPRCEWKHANNSFLVHGYYNYHHLILTVCDGQLKLGVPGVYHPQEAKAAEPIYPIEKVYKFKIPSVENFDISKIYKVMDDKLKVAEICLEYLKNDHIASKAVVVYTGQGGAADYTRGLVAYLVDDDGNVSDIDKNGGTVAFNYNENTLDYVAGNSNAVQTVYLSAFGITTEEQENAVEVVAEPYLVADISGNSYPTVKIGSEVWLGTNLRTTKFGDGSEIPFSAMNSLNQQVASYTYPGGDSDVDASLYGYLYTSKVVADEDLLAGSIVDGLWRISTGGGNNSNGLMGNVTDWQRLFKYIGQDQLGTLLAPGYNWNNGGNGAFDINTVSDLTGLSIVPAGQIYSNGAFALGYLGQAFFFYGNAGQGYNLAERDGKAADQAGVRQWNHVTDACSIRLVRIDNHQ